MKPAVDVVVPVYRGFDATKRCLKGILAHPQATPFELVVVNDASPDPRIPPLLRDLKDKHGITLIEHADNRGFVLSVNEAIVLHPDRDIVLLNSDTEVAGDWLDRLAACADTNSRVGTVTPFSNNATICSYPKFCDSNPKLSDLTLSEIDGIFREKGDGLAFELPTGVGFCLYIRRACLAAVGDFNAERFGRGYGEEVDFCMRAGRYGFRHLLCANTYVFHEGSVSFGDATAARISDAQRVVDGLYPQFPGLIREHVRKDPARPVRRLVDVERLRRSSKPCLLMVTHGWGGGVQRHVEDLTRMLSDDMQILVLTPYSRGVHTLAWANDGEELELFLDLTTDYRLLVDYLKQIGIARVHYHHVQGFPPSILKLADDLSAPYWCTLHDYFAICPQYNLSAADGAYCGEPDLVGCDRCLSVSAPQWPWDIRRWREELGGFLKGAQVVITPTNDVAKRVSRYIQGINPVTLGHPEPRDEWPHSEAVPPSVHRKIAVPGHLTTQKGLATLIACARHARDHRLPLAFRILGTLGSPELLEPEIPLSITGEFEEGELYRRIIDERPDAFLFVSDVPETFSYTLSCAMRTGLPIVAVDRGAFPERLRHYPAAHIVPPGTPASDWNQLLLSLPSMFTMPPAAAGSGTTPGATNRSDYLHRYLEGLKRREPGSLLDELPHKHYYFPEEQRLAAPSLQQLVSDALDRGLKEPAEQLRRSADEASARLSAQDSLIEDLRNQLDIRATQFNALTEEIAQLKNALKQFEEANKEFEAAHQKHVAHLESTIGGLRNRIAELEGSSFWRFTYPLRILAHAAKLSRKQLGDAAHGLPARTRKVVDTLQRQGVKGLIHEVRKRRKGLQLAPDRSNTPAHTLSSEKTIRPLAIPRSDSPIVSIIIPTYGQHRTTFACLESIAENSQDIALEIVLIDDCFTESAKTAFSDVEGIEIVRNAENLGFLRSCNRGVELARAEYVVLLNNDTLVSAGWLDHLLAVFKHFDDVGAVGAKLLFPDGKLQEAGGIVWRDASAWNLGRGQDPSAPVFNYVRQVDYCSGACLMLPRQLFRDLGGFDERFAPAYYEDTDLCFSIRERGLRVYYQPKAEIIHFEGVSHGTDETSGTKAYQARNQKLFAEKWRMQLSGHMPNGVMPEQERDRGVTARVLWIEACMLTPDQDSGSLRTARLLRILRQLGTKVTFMADNLEYRQPYAEALQQDGIEVLYNPYVSSVEDYLYQHVRRHDAVVLCRHYIAAKYVDLIRRLAPEVKVVFDTIDLHFLRLRRQASLDGKAKTKKLAKTAYEEELHVMENSDLTLVVSDVEKTVVRSELPEANVMVLSNVHDPADEISPLQDRRDIMFVGGFQHPPNIDAVEYYADEIWPLVRKALPEVKTYIIGSKMTEDLKRRGEAAGLAMLGYVPDIEPYLNGCRLSVSPLRFGAGVKGKVNQSMSYGLPVVASPASVEGMAMVNGENILIADTAADFAEAVVRLYKDDQLWQRLSRGGIENIRAQFCSETARGALREMLGQITGSGPALPNGGSAR